jgi:hypothetical protein
MVGWRSGRWADGRVGGWQDGRVGGGKMRGWEVAR